MVLLSSQLLECSGKESVPTVEICRLIYPGAACGPSGVGVGRGCLCAEVCADTGAFVHVYSRVHVSLPGHRRVTATIAGIHKENNEMYKIKSLYNARIMNINEKNGAARVIGK